MDKGRSPLGLRGLKYPCSVLRRCLPVRRSPLGLRGLKYSVSRKSLCLQRPSQPTRAAWIEIAI